MDAFLSQKEVVIVSSEEDWKEDLRDLSKSWGLPDSDQNTPVEGVAAEGEEETEVGGGEEPGADEPEAPAKPEEATEEEPVGTEEGEGKKQ